MRAVARLPGIAGLSLLLALAAAPADAQDVRRRCLNMGLELGLVGDGAQRFADACVANGGRAVDPRPYRPVKTTPPEDPKQVVRRCLNMGLELGLVGDGAQRFANACVANGGRAVDPRPYRAAKAAPAATPATRARTCAQTAQRMGLRGSQRAAFLGRCERG